MLTKAPVEDYYTHVRMNGRDYTVNTFGPLISRPTDKKDHYVKRCVAIAGDTRNRDGQLLLTEHHKQSIQAYKTAGSNLSGAINPVHLRDIGINSSEVWYDPTLRLSQLPPQVKCSQVGTGYVVSVTNVDITGYPDPTKCSSLCGKAGLRTTMDLFYPARSHGRLDTDNIDFYRRIIDVYEDNDFEEQEASISSMVKK